MEKVSERTEDAGDTEGEFCAMGKGSAGGPKVQTLETEEEELCTDILKDKDFSSVKSMKIWLQV